jgi:hypothetical protein
MMASNEVIEQHQRAFQRLGFDEYAVGISDMDDDVYIELAESINKALDAKADAEKPVCDMPGEEVPDYTKDNPSLIEDECEDAYQASELLSSRLVKMHISTWDFNSIGMNKKVTLTEEEQKAFALWFEENMIYCSHSHSFVHRLFDYIRVLDKNASYHDAQHAAFMILKNMLLDWMNEVGKRFDEDANDPNANNPK